MTDANVSVSFSASVADFVAGVGQAKDALQSFSAPFGDLNGQLASLTKASAEAFSAARFEPYRDALTETQSLEQSLAADRAQAAAAMRAGDDEAYADATRAAQLAATEELRLIEDGLKQKLALYAEEARAYAISQSEKLALSAQAINEAYALELGALKEREALGDQSLAAKQRVDDLFIEATRRRDDEMTSLSRSALQEQEQTTVVRQYDRAGVQFPVARPPLGNRELAYRLQDRPPGPADQVHRVYRDDRRASSDRRDDEDGGDYDRGRGANGRRGGRRRGIDGRAGRRDGPLDPLVGRRELRRRIRFPRAVDGAVRGRTGGGGTGDGRRHGRVGRLGRHRHVAGAAGHAHARPSQRTDHAGGRGGAFRSMLGDGAAGGGNSGAVQIHPTTNVHVSALDAGSVSQWMKSNSGTMMKAIDEAMKHGAHLGLKGLGRS